MQGSPRIDELRQKFHENPRRYFAPLANEYRKAGDPEQAIAICRAHLAQQPGHMSGHVVYAQSLYDAGRTDESRVVFEKALSLDPDNAIVLRYLGDISRQRGDSSEALHWYSRALEADPHDSQVAAYVAELTEPLTEAAVSQAPKATSHQPPATRDDEPEVTSHDESQPTSDEPEATSHEAESAEPVAESAEAPVESAESDSEIALPEPAKEPEVIAAAESPFVTRTMAELYASQGHRDAALEVYQQLATANPDDLEITNRIRELSLPREAFTEQPSVDVASEHASSEATIEPISVDAVTEQPSVNETSEQSSTDAISEQPADQPATAAGEIPTMEPVEFADFAPSENETPNEFTELTDFDRDLTFHSELEPEPEPEAVPDADPGESSESHFTETEIGESHKWEEGVWGEGFSTGEMEVMPYDFAPSELAAEDEPAINESTDDAATPSAAAPSIEEAHADEVEASSLEETHAEESPQETETRHEPVTADTDASADALEIAGHGSASVPLGVLNDAHEDIAEELAASTQPATASDETQHEETREEESLVAYSPQTPDEDELPHYEPQGPTIREFFATLGARRPPTNGASESFTAHAAVPGVDAIDDLPLASDAFSNLFADAPVNEDDAKAAFALSGAMGAHAPSPEMTRQRATPQSAAPPVQPPAPQTSAAPPAIPPAAQESEEDIRRFREWLDGLADA